MVTTKNLHVRAAAFDKLAERLAVNIHRKLDSGFLDKGLAAMMRKRGWTCTPPTTTAAQRKGRK